MESAQVGGIGFNNYVARHDNFDSININPAGLGEKNPKAVNMTYRTKFSEMERDDLGVSGVWDNFGLGLDVGDFDFNSPATNTNMAFYGGAGFSLSKNILMGASFTHYMKSFGKEFPGGTYSGIYFSPGIILKMGEQVSFGLLSQNLGWEIKKGEKETFKLQKTVRGCLQFEPDKGLFLMGGASYYEGATNVAGSLGAEYTFKITSNGSICLRGGYDSSSLSYGGLTSGIGFILDQHNQDNRVQLDYSITSNPTVGLTHRISISGLWPSQAEKKLAEKPSIKIAEGPAEIKQTQIQIKDKFLSIPGGAVFFEYQKATMKGITEEGMKALEKMKQLIAYLYSIGLCGVEVGVEGNASAEGTEEFNNKLSLRRAMRGKEVLLDAVRDVDPSILARLHVTLTPKGDTEATGPEEIFKEDWRKSHEGVGPSNKMLEAFREPYRNFTIKIKLNIERWAELKQESSIADQIEKLSPGLCKKLNDAYDAAVKK